MIKKLMIIFVLLALTGCLPYVKQNFTSYSFNGQEVTLGMNTDKVREIAGTPAIITIPDPLPNFNTNTMFVIDAAFRYLTNVRPYYQYYQYWQYGSFEDGDKEKLRITFANGIVTKIRKFTKK